MLKLQIGKMRKVQYLCKICLHFFAVATAACRTASGGGGGGRGGGGGGTSYSGPVLMSWLGFKPPCPRLQLGLAEMAEDWTKTPQQV